MREKEQQKKETIKREREREREGKRNVWVTNLGVSPETEL